MDRTDLSAQAGTPHVRGGSPAKPWLCPAAEKRQLRLLSTGLSPHSLSGGNGVNKLYAPHAVSSATCIMFVKEVCLASADISSPLTIESETVKIASASTPARAAVQYSA